MGEPGMNANQIVKITSAKSRIEFLSTQFCGRENKSGDERVLINFQEFDATQSQGSRVVAKTCASVRFSDFLALVSFAESGALAASQTIELKRMQETKEKYARNIWESRYGGGRNANGEVVSRRFAITLATQSRTAEYMIVATETPGATTSKGAIIPQEGAKPNIIVRVPVSFLDLYGALLLVRMHIQAFISQTYASLSVHASSSGNIVRGYPSSPAIDTPAVGAFSDNGSSEMDQLGFFGFGHVG